jgi:hypothetical protein
MDFVAPLVPLGLGFGRIGNFINGELWGKVTTSPLGMYIQEQGVSRYPSQLYEAFLEGLVLFVILWLYSNKPRPLMSVSALFLIFYGAFRFIIEFVRVPDVQLGYLAFEWLTMGQLLSLPMIILGITYSEIFFPNEILSFDYESLDIKKLQLNNIIDKNKLFEEPPIKKNDENEGAYTPAEREQMDRLNNIETIETESSN